MIWKKVNWFWRQRFSLEISAKRSRGGQFKAKIGDADSFAEVPQVVVIFMDQSLADRNDSPLRKLNE